MEIGTGELQPSVGDNKGPRAIGPTLTLELPVFDRRQAFIERLGSQHRQSLQELDGLAIVARAAARTGWQQVQARSGPGGPSPAAGFDLLDDCPEQRRTHGFSTQGPIR